jgi:hypothetical protein
MKPAHAINASDQANPEHQAWAMRTLEAGTQYAINGGLIAEADAINACDQVPPIAHQEPRHEHEQVVRPLVAPHRTR